jgi:hypothetical protein
MTFFCFVTLYFFFPTLFPVVFNEVFLPLTMLFTWAFFVVYSYYVSILLQHIIFRSFQNGVTFIFLLMTSLLTLNSVAVLAAPL